jgi:riboflavin synthase
MFSGIVEAKTKLLNFAANPQNPSETRIEIEKPIEFEDLSIGDSIAVNGVCLTLEKFTNTTLQFCLGAETLNITGWSAQTLAKLPLNLERSLKFGDRIHGHIVLGHVDGLCEVTSIKNENGCLIVRLKVPQEQLPLIWPKGSVCLQGVSLTINAVTNDGFEVCLIPETLRQTNLVDIQVGDQLNLEVDQMARGLQRQFELNKARGTNEHNL